MESRWPTSTKGSVLFLSALIIVIVLIFGSFSNWGKDNHIKQAQAQVVTRDDKASPSPTPSSVLNLTTDEETGAGEAQTQIDNYIKTIFRGDSVLALAVQRSECNPANEAYPKCIYKHDGPEVDPKLRELSCSQWQINVYAHSDKIPFTGTFQEQCNFLNENVNIATLVAYKIYTSHNNTFSAWAGYSTGKYERFLNE